MLPRPTASPFLSLPLELVELVFQQLSSSVDMKNLRVTCRTFAAVGIPLLFSHYTYYPWRDIGDLLCISASPSLGQAVRSVTFNFSDLDEYEARHASFYDNYLLDPEERAQLLQDAWREFYSLRVRRSRVPKLRDNNGETLSSALAALPALKTLRLVWGECPYKDDVLRRTFESRPGARDLDAGRTMENLDIVFRALAERSRGGGRGRELRKLAIDRFPVSEPSILLEPVPVWGEALKRTWEKYFAAFAPGLDELELTLDRVVAGVGVDAVDVAGELVRRCENVRRLAVNTRQDVKKPPSVLSESVIAPATFGMCFPRLEDLSIDESGQTVFLKQLVSFFAEGRAPALRRFRLKSCAPTQSKRRRQGLDAAEIPIKSLVEGEEADGDKIVDLAGFHDALLSLQYVGILTHVAEERGDAALLYVSSEKGTAQALDIQDWCFPPGFVHDILCRVRLVSEGHDNGDGL